MGWLPLDVANREGGAMYACKSEGEGVTVVKLAYAICRPLIPGSAVMFASPATKVVVRPTRTEMLPAGMYMLVYGNDTIPSALEESVTGVFAEETAGSPVDVARPTSSA